MYILLTGKPPFDGEDDEIIKQKVMTGKYSMSDPVWKHVSQEAIQLLKSMMCTDVSQRVTAKKALDHAWFQNASSQAVDENLLQQTL